MATRKGKQRVRRGRNDVWRSSLYGLDMRRALKSKPDFVSLQQSPLALQAGVYGEVEPVYKDLSWYDYHHPRSVARCPLVPEPERVPVFK